MPSKSICARAFGMFFSFVWLRKDNIRKGKSQPQNLRTKITELLFTIPNRTSIIFVTLALLLISALAPAQTIRNAKERHDDKKGAAAAAIGVADDRRDLNRLSDLVMLWDDLRQSGQDTKEVEQRIAAELRRDLVETKVQAQQADIERAQSSREVRGSWRELRHERRDGDGNAHERRDDRRDLRNDRQDRRDDRRDAQRADEIFQRKQAIAKELIVLQKQTDTAGKLGDKLLQEKQSKLLEEYLALSREEIKLGVREAQEDKRELREDRRETHEDRRN